MLIQIVIFYLWNTNRDGWDMRGLWPTVQYQKSHKSTIKVVHMTPYALYSCEIILLWSQRKWKKSKNLESLSSPHTLRTTGLSMLCTFSILLSFLPFPFILLPSFFLSFSDMKGERGVWSEQTASSPTVLPAWCRPQWGPVNATVLRAWRRGPGVPHTVALLSPTGRPCSTATLSTRLGTLRIATGAQERPLSAAMALRTILVCAVRLLCISVRSLLYPWGLA